MGIWRFKGVRGNTEQGMMCRMCSKEEGLSHKLRSEETRSWRQELVYKRFKSIDPEIGIRIVTNKNIYKLQKTGLY
jgi:hypothetical protein